MGTGVRALGALLVILAGLRLPFPPDLMLDVVGIVALLVVALLPGTGGSPVARVAGIVALVLLACAWAIGYGAVVDDTQWEAIRQVLLVGMVLLLGVRLGPAVTPVLPHLPRVPLLHARPLVALGAAADALLITHPAFVVPLDRAGLVTTGPSPWAALVTLLVVLVVLGEGAHRYVELPIRKALT